MGSGASQVAAEVQAASPADLTAALSTLSADDLAKIEAAIAGSSAAGACPGPVDCSCITTVAKDYRGLLDQPAEPKHKGALCQIYVRGAPYGGSDKSSNGHRYDSIPFANGMILSGMSCQLIHYVYEEHDKFFQLCKNFDFIIVRCNPGQIKADGGDQVKFDNGMRGLRKLGIQVWPSPDVMEKMGAKDALCKVANMNIGLPDTLAYYTEAEFTAGFKKTMAFQPRVIKQNRGSSGEGIWIIKLQQGNYCAEYGERSCEDSEVLVLMEANDNHEETHTVAEFIEFCVAGRTEKSGDWTSKGTGKYLEGGKEAGGQLVDQRFCPRIIEGELRYNLVGDALVGIIHKKPKEGGISAVGGTGSVYTYFGPDEPKFMSLTDGFLKKDLPLIMPALELPEEPIPLWWTTDFILSSPEGTPADQEKWIVGEFNCSCVGISRCLAAYCKDDTPSANYDDISAEDKAEADRYGKLMGEKALGILAKAPVSEAPAPATEAPAPVSEAPAPAAEAAAATPRSAGYAEEEPKATPTLEEIFNAIDTDKSGLIDAKELGHVLKQLGCEKTEEEVAKIISSSDLNGDQKLSLEEYAKLVAKV
eukprot:TRINITY_DN3436_c0_g1_i1.p1 TRINITY_DN3436_c0_g1~~TRINITY_DN3436_c0_g1_i1.p1  ORF type:complete len:589 (+),score=169.67 TRINITY_DN3436_c0_g1_i1:46-1812(+)